MTVARAPDVVHFLDSEKHWALCGALPEGPSWSGAPEGVTCPWCLQRLNRRRAALQQVRPPAELVGGGEVELAKDVRAPGGDPVLPQQVEGDPAAGER